MRRTGRTTVVPRFCEQTRPSSTVISRPATVRNAASSSSMCTEGTQLNQPGGLSQSWRVRGETRSSTSALWPRS